jgi:hypothetical protein
MIYGFQISREPEDSNHEFTGIDTKICCLIRVDSC